MGLHTVCDGTQNVKQYRYRYFFPIPVFLSVKWVYLFSKPQLPLFSVHIFTASLFSGPWPWSASCWRACPASSSPSPATSSSSCFQSASSASASPSSTPLSCPCSDSSLTRSTPPSTARSMPLQIYPIVQVPHHLMWNLSGYCSLFLFLSLCIRPSGSGPPGGKLWVHDSERGGGGDLSHLRPHRLLPEGHA